MKLTMRQLSLGMACLGLMFPLFGCAVHTHKSVSTYEYSDERGAPPREVEHEHVDSEYHMVAPGTMVVDPARK